MISIQNLNNNIVNNIVTDHMNSYYAYDDFHIKSSPSNGYDSFKFLKMLNDKRWINLYNNFYNYQTITEGEHLDEPFYTN